MKKKKKKKKKFSQATFYAPVIAAEVMYRPYVVLYAFLIEKKKPVTRIAKRV